MLFSAPILFAQNKSLSFDFEWSENTKNKELLIFDGASYDGGTPVLSTKIAIPSNQGFRVENLSYTSEEVPAKYLPILSAIDLRDEPNVKVEAKSARKRWFKTTFVLPFYKKNNKIYRLKNINFEVVSVASNAMKAGVQTFASESVLREGNGDWYKIAIQNTGIQRLDFAFLESLGIDMTNLNPNHIHVFGNSQGILPINNSGYRPDDLIENAIFIQGDQDNIFNTNDFVLFYAKGSDVIEKNGSELNIVNNIYTDLSYYFININAAEDPKRISDATLSVGVPTHTVTKFHDVKRHENDEVNIVKTGQRWYGELFDTQLTRSFAFSFPNIDVSEQVNLRAAFGSNKESGTASLKINYSGNELTNENVIGNVSSSGTGTSLIRETIAGVDFTPVSGNISLSLTFDRSSPSTQGWLDFIELEAVRDLKMSGGQMSFRNKDAEGVGNIAQYFITSANANLKVWDVTDPANVMSIPGNLSGNVYDFTIANDTLKEFVAYNGGQYFEPSFTTQVTPQNLHALEQAELLIVTHPDFLSQATRLADLHREDGMLVNVVTTSQIYNEFSGGMQDPTAIKQFAKMFYDRAEIDGSLYPKNICLFGDGTYDPKNRIAGNNYYVPVYELEESEHSFNSMVMDDFFAILDDNESVAPSDLLDIGVGRIIVSSPSQATAMVNKIEHYMRNGSNFYSGTDGVVCDDNGFLESTGDWKNKVVLVADDEDGNHFPKECEKAYDTLSLHHPRINVGKIYADAYPQVSTTGGQRFPEVNNLIDRAVNEGALFVNYVGHGGETGWAHERILNVPMVNAYKNIGNLTTVLSATCEFCRFDDPTRISGGEYFFLNQTGGAVALFTTTRSVLFSVNDDVNEAFYKRVFETDANGDVPTMGEILMRTLNDAPAGNNKRSFTLIGDPALRFSVPKNRVVITHVNGNDITTYEDTLKALENATIRGYVADWTGAKITDYNGVLFPRIFDKAQQKQTLGQDTPVFDYELRENTLYKGKVSVTNGDFEYEFIIPKDIDYAYGQGKISSYSTGSSGEASGGDFRVKVGGVNPNGINDDQGPQITLYLNDENFANGGMTDQTPILVAEVFDESGINTVGNGIGHDITVILDQNTSDQIILNNYYEADLDTYKSGKVNYQFDELSEGTHTLTFKVWDVNNNSSEETIEFVVRPLEEIQIDHVLNYPNPFTTNTQFFFEHNQVCQSLETQIQIFTVSGKLVKTINENVKTNGFRTEGIQWDGRDDFGDKIGRGVYVYKVTVTNPDGSKADKLEKLVLL